MSAHDCVNVGGVDLTASGVDYSSRIYPKGRSFFDHLGFCYKQGTVLRSARIATVLLL